MENPGDMINLGPAWHYRLEAEIARSTFGVVWQAVWLQTGARVALKTVHRERMLRAGTEQQALWPQALRHEADYLRRMDHPHLVRLRHDGEERGMPVLVLEQLHTSLARWCSMRASPLPLNEALEQVGQAANGLAYLHRQGMRHLDVKPENLLLTAPGPLQRLKIADLGAAAGLYSDTAAHDEHGFTGSLGWLAPEQVFPSRIESGVSGKLYYRTSVSTDVYGLGLLLFYLLTGERTCFNKRAAALLQEHPHMVLEHREFLTQLAQTGLSEDDSAHLAWVSGGAVDAKRALVALQTPIEATWAPCAAAASEPPPTCTFVPAPIMPTIVASHLQTKVENLLRSLLAFNPAQRLVDASAVCKAVTEAQCTWGAG
jgi:serine/threonine-protein kinase